MHNPDVQSYARLLKKAEEAGIYVVQVNMRSSYSTDVFVGADYVGMGEQIGQRLVDKCSPANGGSGKVAITQGVLTAAASIYQMQGINNVLSKHPEIQLVSNQAADWDATKAKNIAATVIQQHPDLCAITGFWDVMDVGTAAAIKESGKNVYLLTQGGGNRMACDGLANGTYSEVGRLLRAGPGPRHGDHDQAAAAAEAARRARRKTTLFTPLTFLTKDNMTPASCWDLPAKN